MDIEGRLRRLCLTGHLTAVQPAGRCWIALKSRGLISIREPYNGENVGQNPPLSWLDYTTHIQYYNNHHAFRYHQVWF